MSVFMRTSQELGEDHPGSRLQLPTRERSPAACPSARSRLVTAARMEGEPEECTDLPMSTCSWAAGHVVLGVQLSSPSAVTTGAATCLEFPAPSIGHPAL